MRLVRPSGEFETSYRTYLAEVRERGERLIPFQLSLPDEDFPALLATLEANGVGRKLPETFVPNSTYWLVDRGEIVGVSNLRHRLTAALEKRGGHIGYSIRPGRRQRGYGTEILKRTLGEASKFGLKSALVTCSKENIGSIKVISANGGVLLAEGFIPEHNEVVQRYRVPVPWRGSDCPQAVEALLASLGIEYEQLRIRSLVFQPQATHLAIAEPDDREPGYLLHPAAANAWQAMKHAAGNEGVVLRIASAFRTIDRQAEIVRSKIETGASLESILRVSAPPGFSEHHSGFAVDIATNDVRPLEPEFAETAAFRWLCTNAARFGFSLSFPAGNRHGYAYEPWHWCYREESS